MFTVDDIRDDDMYRKWCHTEWCVHSEEEEELPAVSFSSPVPPWGCSVLLRSMSVQILNCQQGQTSPEPGLSSVKQWYVLKGALEDQWKGSWLMNFDWLLILDILNCLIDLVSLVVILINSDITVTSQEWIITVVWTVCFIFSVIDLFCGSLKCCWLDMSSIADVRHVCVWIIIILNDVKSDFC